MSTAEKFKALGAGNGLTFCKAKAPTETRNKPTSVLTLKECMAWYWLLKDIEIELTLENQHDGNGDGVLELYQSSLTLEFDVISGRDEDLGDDGKRFYNVVPKDRAVLHPEERHEMTHGKFSHFNNFELETPQSGGVGPINSFLPGGHSSGMFDVHMVVEWFDNDTASVVILLDNNYHRFVLTNLPTTSDLFIGTNFFGHNTNHTLTEGDPNSLGTISTPYGDLEAYDVSTSDFNEVTAVNGTIQFYDFGS